MTTGRYYVALVVIIVVSLFCAWLVAKKRREIIAWLKRWSGSSGLLLWVGKILPPVSAALATWNEVWKPSQWTAHPIVSAYSAYLIVAMLMVTYAAEFLREALKEQATIRIKELETEQGIIRAERDRWVRLATQVRRLLDRKIEALSVLAPKPRVTSAEFLRAWDPEIQIHTIVKSIHEFFHFELMQNRPAAKLRLGLYVPVGDCLEPLYSWDGQHESCIRSHPDRMRLISADGIQSLIVEAFHRPGDHQLTVIPDCEGDRTFRFFTASQEKYLRSMIAFKYKAQIDGTKTALVVSLDTDEPGFFSHERATEISAFLVEMMKRFEYEILNLEITRKLSNEP